MTAMDVLRGRFFARLGGHLTHAASALGVGFVLLAWMLVAPIVRVLTWCRWVRAEPAIAMHETAITNAAVMLDRIEEASALAESGFLALRGGHFARAEDRLRSAIALLATDDLPYLQATLHHHMAIALHGQRKEEEAERHAAAALARCGDPGARLAHRDRALLAWIRAQRASESTQRSTQRPPNPTEPRRET